MGAVETADTSRSSENVGEEGMEEETKLAGGGWR